MKTTVIANCILILFANATAAFIAAKLHLPVWSFGTFLAVSTAYFLRACYRLHTAGRTERTRLYIDRVTRHCTHCSLTHFLAETKDNKCPDCSGDLISNH